MVTISNRMFFELRANIVNIIESIPGYSINKIPGKSGLHLIFKEKLMARWLLRKDFIGFLEEYKINWRQILSKKHLIDGIVYIIVKKTLFIIDFKYQKSSEYVYHKLQTCDFKRKQYLKLVSTLGLKVEYVYVLNDWFRKPEYKDVLDYIHSVNCHYRFNELPLAWLGLPT